jgi:hypothetical protein
LIKIPRYSFIPYNRRFIKGVFAGKYGATSQEQEDFGAHMRAQINLPPSLPSYTYKSLKEARPEKVETP